MYVQAEIAGYEPVGANLQLVMVLTDDQGGQVKKVVGPFNAGSITQALLKSEVLSRFGQTPADVQKTLPVGTVIDLTPAQKPAADAALTAFLDALALCRHAHNAVALGILAADDAQVIAAEADAVKAYKAGYLTYI